MKDIAMKQQAKTKTTKIMYFKMNEEKKKKRQ